MQPLTETELPLAGHPLTILFHDARLGHLETLQETIEGPPPDASALTPPVEPLVQRPASLVVEELHPAVIADQPVVVPRPLQLGLEGFH